MIRICIADDHPVVRKGLARILSDAPGLSVAGEAENGPALLEMIRKEDYDTVLLDISMPGMDGFDVLKRLKNERPGLPVLMLSIHPEEGYAIRAFRGGASGYLGKDASPEELVAAVRIVSAGRKYIGPSLADRMAEELAERTDQPLHEGLSDREHRVMTMIGAGKSGKEIAAELRLSVKTVSTYRARILRKLKLRNNMEIVRYALERRLIP